MIPTNPDNFSADDAQRYFGVSLPQFHAVLAQWPLIGTDSIHGPDHWARVSCNAQHILQFAYPAYRTQLLPAVRLFALLHDSRRQDEGWDTTHGERAAELLRGHSARLCPHVDAQLVEHVASACSVHTVLQPWQYGFTHAPKRPESWRVLVACCLDADRLDLTRLGRTPDPRFLFTPWTRDAVARGVYGFSD
jgi:uncharacterized protein